MAKEKKGGVMSKETKCRIILSDDNIHFQEYEADGRILTGDFWTKPDGFEFYYETVKDGQPMLIEIPWQHFHGVLRALTRFMSA